jgi:hypothetical protein
MALASGRKDLMANFEKIQLGFDEAFLNDQLQKTYGTFDVFAQNVRSKLDESVFSEESLRRMYVANERLREYTAMLQQVEIKKQQIAAGDEVAFKRLAAEQAHLASGQQREAYELERARRGLPSSQAMGGGGGGSAGTFVGSAMLAAGQSLGSAVLGHEIGSIAQGVAELRAAYRKRDPVTGERDDAAISGAWSSFGTQVAKFAVTQLIAGFDIRAQQAEGYKALYRGQGYDVGEERFRGLSDMDIVRRYGMSRMEAMPLLEQMGRQTGRTGGFEDILTLQRQTGLGSEGVGLLGAAARRGVGMNEQQQAQFLASAIGLAVAENLPKGRLGEILTDLQHSILQGRGALDIETEMRTRLAAARAGGAEYAGERGGNVSTVFGQMGMKGGIGEGVAIMLQMRQGKSFIDAKIGAEKGYFKTAAGVNSLISYVRSNFRTRDQRVLFLQQMASTGFIDADMIDRMIDQLDSGGDLTNDMERARLNIQGYLGTEKLEDIAPGEMKRAAQALQAEAGKPLMEASKTASQFMQAFPSHPLATTGRFLGRAGVGALNSLQWLGSELVDQTVGRAYQGYGLLSGQKLSNRLLEPQMITEYDMPSLRYNASEPGGQRPYHVLGHGPDGTDDGALDLSGASISDPVMLNQLRAAASDYFRKTGKKLRLGGSVGGDRTAAQQEDIRRRHAGDNVPVAQNFSQHEAGRAVDVSDVRGNPDLVNALLSHGFIKPKRLMKGGVDSDPPHFEFGEDRPVSKSEVNTSVNTDGGTRVDVRVNVSKAPHKINDTSGDSGIPSKGRGLITTNNRPDGSTNG